MTREQSALETKRKIKMATCGKEVAEAMIAHFREYVIPNTKFDKVDTPIDVLNSPLLTHLS